VSPSNVVGLRHKSRAAPYPHTTAHFWVVGKPPALDHNLQLVAGVASSLLPNPCYLLLTVVIHQEFRRLGVYEWVRVKRTSAEEGKR
jgi:hypothetical protein